MEEYWELISLRPLLATQENIEKAKRVEEEEVVDWPKHWLTVLINTAEGEDVTDEVLTDFLSELFEEI